MIAAALLAAGAGLVVAGCVAAAVCWEAWRRLDDEETAP